MVSGGTKEVAGRGVAEKQRLGLGRLTWKAIGVFLRINTFASACVRLGVTVWLLRSCSLAEFCSSLNERNRPCVSVALSGSSGAESTSPQIASPPWQQIKTTTRQLQSYAK